MSSKQNVESYRCVSLPSFHLPDGRELKRTKGKKMAQTRKPWNQTKASKTEVRTGNFIKLENLCEIKFSIVDVVFEPSSFNKEVEQVRVTFTYDEDEGTDMEGLEFQFTTTQQAIMQRMHDLDVDDLPVGPVTVFETGRSKQYGTVFYDIGDTVPEIDSPKPVHVDVRENASRQRLAGQSLRSKSAR